MQVEDAAQQQLVAELQAENRRLQVPCTAGMSASHAKRGLISFHIHHVRIMLLLFC